MAQTRPAPFLVGDDLALDFLNSTAAPTGEPIEWLANGLDLIAWLEHVHAVPPDVASHFRKEVDARTLDAVANDARELREWFRTFVRHHAGKILGAAALRSLAPVNELLAQDAAFRQVAIRPPRHARERSDGEHRPLRWDRRRHWRMPETLLLPIADAIGELVCQKDFRLVRKCESPACTLWFLDVSKAHARRWCSMAVCGNRAKAAAHRVRVRRRDG